MNMNMKTKKLVYGALFAALTCVATMSIHIPIPGVGGYIHPGDTIVVLSGIILGPVYGGLAAGIGSSLSDFLTGYYVYIPITLFVKFVVAFVVGIIYRKVTKAGLSIIPACIVCGIFSTAIVTLGYLFFEYLLFGAAAFTAAPYTFVQGIIGFVLATILAPVVTKIPDLSAIQRQR